MKVGWLAFVLAASALAGCVGAEDASHGTPTSAAERDALQASAALHGCDSWQGLFPMERGAADALLPPGFTATYFTTEPGVEGTVFVLWGLRCQRVQAAELALGPATLVSWNVIVDPPDDFARTDDANHLVALGALADDAALAAMLHGWGAPRAEPAEAEVATENLGPLARSGAVTAGDDSFSLRMNAAATGDAWHFEDRRRFFFVDFASGSPKVSGAFDEDLAGDAPVLGCAAGVLGRASFVVEGDSSAFPAARGEGTVEHRSWPDACASRIVYVPLPGVGS
ncbi:MAG: hypothetical protein ACT4PT_00655 [Methanobacteriota archaeon]